MRRFPELVRHALWLSTCTLVACRLLAGIEDPQPIDSDDGGGLDGSVDDADARVDTGTDGGVEAGGDGGDGGCVSCGTECVFTDSDMRHCGACNTPCVIDAPSTATCALGRCVATLASVPGTVSRPLVAGAYVYFTNTNTSTIVRVPVSGGSPTNVLTPDGGAGPVIASDGARLYWYAGYRIWSASVDGTNVVALTPASVFSNPVGTRADGVRLYFGSSNYVQALAVDGGTPITLATAESTISSLTADTTSFYFTDYATNVSSVSRDGGTPLKIAWSQSSPNDVAVSATDVYWTVNGTTVMKAPIGGGTWTQFVAGVSRIAIDGPDMYGQSSSVGLLKLPLSGGSPTTIGPKTAAPEAIDATSVYWSENGSGVGKIMRLTPK